LKHFRHSDAVISDFTIYTFAPSDHETIRRHELACYATLSEEQATTVCRFLRFMAASDQADDLMAGEALDRYGGRFCA
jgi:hypothetical protein